MHVASRRGHAQAKLAQDAPSWPAGRIGREPVFRRPVHIYERSAGTREAMIAALTARSGQDSRRGALRRFRKDVSRHFLRGIDASSCYEETNAGRGASANDGGGRRTKEQ